MNWISSLWQRALTYFLSFFPPPVVVEDLKAPEYEPIENIPPEWGDDYSRIMKYAASTSSEYKTVIPLKKFDDAEKVSSLDMEKMYRELEEEARKESEK